MGPEPTSPTLGYMQLLNITITIEIVYEVDLTLQIVSMSVLQGKFTLCSMYRGIMLCPTYRLDSCSLFKVFGCLGFFNVHS